MAQTKPDNAPNLTQIWQEMLAHIKLHHSELVRTWFDTLQIQQLDRGDLTILASSPAHHGYLQNHCSNAFAQAAQAATGRLIAVTFAMSSGMIQSSYAYAWDENLMFNEDYIFDHFVVGPSNKLAHAASVAVARDPGRTYNPLFVHGNVGLGKTHLLQAVCQAIRHVTPETKIVYISCETFINHFIEAVEMGTIHEFRHRYRNADVLAIDDVQFLANKDSSQEEFFHTFNCLYQAQKQVLLSSDRPPNEIETLTDRLISRFSWGLVAGIDRPCYETRMAIISKKAKMKGVSMPEEVNSFLARSIEANTRELEGAVTKLQGLSMLGDGEISLDMARKIVPAANLPTRELAIEQIVENVTQHFNVKITELQSKKRNKTLSLPRQICMYLARRLTRRSLQEIGGYFGGRDHSTVLHATKNIQKLLDSDPSLRVTVETISRRLTSASAPIK